MGFRAWLPLEATKDPRSLPRLSGAGGAAHRALPEAKAGSHRHLLDRDHRRGPSPGGGPRGGSLEVADRERDLQENQSSGGHQDILLQGPAAVLQPAAAVLRGHGGAGLHHVDAARTHTAVRRPQSRHQGNLAQRVLPHRRGALRASPCIRLHDVRIVRSSSAFWVG